MSEKDDIIQHQLYRIAELEEAERRQFDTIKARNDELDRLQAELHKWLELADTSAQRINALVEQRRMVQVNTAEAVASLGKENGYCRDGMADFLCWALGITESEAADLLAPFFRERVSITIEAEVEGREHDHLTVNEVTDLLVSALGCVEVFCPTAAVRIDDVD